MIIAKYNIPSGSSPASGKGASAVAGGTGTANVDLTAINTKVAALELKVSQLETQLTRANAVLAGLDARFLSKLGDVSEYSYRLGSVYTDFLQSGMFDDGVGYRLSGSATATIEDKYNMIIKDVGWSRIAFNTVEQEDATLVDRNTDEVSDQLNATVNIGATNADGYMLIDCGATLTNGKYFTVISKSVEYDVQTTIGQQTTTEQNIVAETDSNGNFILFFDKADAVTFTIRFTYTYVFRRYDQLTVGAYRLYIRGTDPSNNQTDCFGASAKTVTLNASGLTVLNGLIGKRITSNGVQTTSDGGTTWT